MREFVYNSDMVQDNIKEVWDQHTFQEYQDGSNWYWKANDFSLDLSKEYGVTPAIAAGVISALSPQKEWNHNKELAREFFELMDRGRTLWRKSRHTFLQKTKAKNIYYINDDNISKIEEYLGGNKTKNFFRNILNPKDFGYVTVDRHAMTMALGWHKGKLTNKQYFFLKDEFIKFADHINMHPVNVQGITWLTYKRIKKV